VNSSFDVNLAQQAARTISHTLTFDEKASEEIVIVASELASNLVKHGGGGTLTFVPLETSGRVGLQIESKDSGPCIADVEKALADGFSTAGSLGYGLGAVNRLMDELEISSLPEHGTRVTCWRWLRSGRTQLHRSTRLLEFGAATRSYRQMNANGDAFVLKRWENAALAGVIDGLGHGELAQRAAQAARRYVESHFDQPLEAIFRGVGRACHSTRGVVMALARFNLAEGKLSFASVGNIEARLLGIPKPVNFIFRRGIVGVNAPNPVITEHTWSPSGLLVLHSDGLRTHWTWKDFPDLALDPATTISQRLLRSLDKGEDDATVVVVKGVVP